jgi:hypothetical protein
MLSRRRLLTVPSAVTAGSVACTVLTLFGVGMSSPSSGLEVEALRAGADELPIWVLRGSADASGSTEGVDAVELNFQFKLANRSLRLSLPLSREGVTSIADASAFGARLPEPCS